MGTDVLRMSVCVLVCVSVCHKSKKLLAQHWTQNSCLLEQCKRGDVIWTKSGQHPPLSHIQIFVLIFFNLIFFLLFFPTPTLSHPIHTNIRTHTHTYTYTLSYNYNTSTEKNVFVYICTWRYVFSHWVLRWPVYCHFNRPYGNQANDQGNSIPSLPIQHLFKNVKQYYWFFKAPLSIVPDNRSKKNINFYRGTTREKETK